MKPIPILVIFFYVLCTPLGFGQTTSDSLNVLLKQNDYWQNSRTNDRYEKRIEVGESILALDCKENLLTDSLNAMVFYHLSRYYGKIGYAEQALYYARGALDYARKYQGFNEIGNIKYLNKMAQVFTNYFGEVESVLQIRKEIEKIRLNIPIEKISEDVKNRIYENLIFLANQYVELKEEEKFNLTYTQIDQLYQTGLFTRIFNAYEYALFKSYGYLSFKRVAEAYQIIYPEYQKQDSLFRATQSNINEILIIQTVLSEIYLELKKPQKALDLYYKSNAIQEQKARGAILYEAYIAYIGAQSMTDLKQYSKSKKVLKNIILKLEKFRSKNPGSINTDLAELYEHLAKNQYLAYSDRTDILELHQAYNYSLQAQYCLKSSWQLLKNQNDLKYSLNNNYAVFETSLLILHELHKQTDSLHYFEEALRIVELTKNVALRASLNEEKVAKEHGISAHLLVRERAFKKQLFDLQYNIDYAENESTKQTLQDSMHIVNEGFLKLQQIIHRQYPNYRHKIQVQQDFDWGELEEHLQKENQTLVYYTSGEEHLFTLGISGSRRVFNQVKIGKDSLRTLVNKLRKGISKSPNHSSDKHLNQLIDLSYQLHEVLVKPIQSIATDRLLIIPDGALEELSFSMLLSKKTPFGQAYNDWPFIVKDYSFSYAYAIDLLLYPAPKSANYSKEKILAFAPNFSISLLRGDSLRHEGQLTDNKEEVAYIEDHFSSTAFYGKQAKLSTFCDLAPDYAVLHLATHGVVDVETGGYSYLAFSATDTFDSQLNVGELYTMDIPAELVVLSACETGLGEWQEGEGVIGLERAFSYAGARSVVTTHWKVSDRASANLMGYFYNELAKGLPKDQALQKAQLAFINEQDSWLAHPFFWAAYVQKGDTAPLSIPLKSESWLWWLLGIGLIGSIFVFYKKRSK